MTQSEPAATVSAAGQMHTDLTNIPVGALIWYDGTPIGNPSRDSGSGTLTAGRPVMLASCVNGTAS